MTSRRGTSKSQVDLNGPSYMSVWFFFQIAAGHIALPLLAATIVLARRVRTRVQVANVCMTWAVASVCWSLLLYAGKYQGPEPGRNLCIAQASLAGAIPIMTCTATLSLAHYLWRTYDDPESPSEFATRGDKAVTIWRLITPYITFGVFVAIGANLAAKHPEKVDRARAYFYCSLDERPFTYAIAIISLLLCVAALTLQAHIVSSMTHDWDLLRRGGHLTDEKVSLVARVGILTLYLLVVTVINLAAIWVDLGVTPDLLHASVEIVVFLTLAAEMAIIRVWCFWRHPPGDRPSSLLTRRPGHLSPHQPFVPALHPSGHTLQGNSVDRSSKNTYVSAKGYYALNANGVEIIGRPDEAFMPPPVRTKPKKKLKRDTISTWGF